MKTKTTNRTLLLDCMLFHVSRYHVMLVVLLRMTCLAAPALSSFIRLDEKNRCVDIGTRKVTGEEVQRACAMLIWKDLSTGRPLMIRRRPTADLQSR